MQLLTVLPMLHPYGCSVVVIYQLIDAHLRTLPTHTVWCLSKIYYTILLHVQLCIIMLNSHSAFVMFVGCFFFLAQLEPFLWSAI